MSKGRTPDYLEHMLKATRLVRTYVCGMTRDTFVEDTRTQQAVEMNLLIIGEAANQLLKEDPSFSDRHPEIPWRDVRTMRNRIIHGYFDINLDIVWDTINERLPGLDAQIVAIQTT